MNTQYEINVSGMSCPTPLNIVARELVKVPIGSRFVIKTDDYVCYMMLLRFLKILGESIESNVEHDNAYIIVAIRNS
ncbi:sulfurtransferase TusA family protein [Caldivirga sp.]|uniref:sulfurtransferase TusA family protein n=1 Tax=Caldivirga sp. TaxID=2080243 RepID=UPI0025BAC11E|nr:sulfurtransferase TusA family protein [Caldivirga sp.]